jgi:hypothetical protein
MAPKRRSNLEGLTDEIRSFFRDGSTPWGLIGQVQAGPQRDAELLDLWTRHGAAVTAEWIREHPDTRPRGWWWYGRNLWPFVGLYSTPTPRQVRYARKWETEPSPEVQRRYLRRFHP